ncbi:hypothetical protein KO02_11470 [Sphingobacterium sp. ML3W]|uniref:hypothetical protein n=1 Tax=Sphingobacterium sp. ML3W TaxID=1538644 RepID=UPI0004F5CF06|nr:hypothetical protein [Sphingobacterium sp. ML3W]AIM37239.1 hypothetical protein KO02_11470 [Sphingobacterium sp. ML3W]
MKSNKITESNKANRNDKVNPKTLTRALRTVKSKVITEDIHAMREIQQEYSTGIQFALGLGYDTFIKRFRDPRSLTLEDLLNLADITDTDVKLLVEIALNEAKKNHICRDISELLPENNND